LRVAPSPSSTAENVGDIPFIDAHHHLWDLVRHQYSWLQGDGDPLTTAWLGDYGAIRRSYALSDFLEESVETGVMASIHVEAGWSDGDPVGETRWVDRLAVGGYPAAIVGRVDLRTRAAARSLDAHAESERFRGVRMTEMHGLVDDPSFRRGIRLLAGRGLAYDLNTCVPWIDEGVRLASLAPAIPVIVDNIANPTSTDRDYQDAWWAGISRLASIENVVMKVAGVGMFDHAWTARSLRPLVRRLIDAFSPSRVMFGSNWPVDALYSTYRSLITTYRQIASEYTLDEQHQLLHGVAERCYRVGPP
jgi:predicted TIM-barrel fold metal-dependent hydrolase